MAKKKIILSEDERYSKEHLLLQPARLVTLSGQFSKLKLNMLIELMAQMNDRVVCTYQRNAGNITQGDSRELSLFDEDELRAAEESSSSIPVFKIPLSQITSDKREYSYIAEAADALLHQSLYYEEKNSYVGINLFQKIEIPKSDTGRRTGYVLFSPTPIAMEKVFTLIGGYSKAIKDAIKALPKNADRLYMNMMPYKAKGEWRIDYLKLRMILGLDYEVVDEQTGKVIKKSSYSAFRNFRSKLLEPALAAINEFADQDNLDIRVDYEILDGAPKNPIFLFKITKTKLGLALDENTRKVKEEVQLRDFLIEKLKISSQSAMHLVYSMDDDMTEAVRNKAMELVEYFEQHPEIKDTKAFARTSLENFINDNKKPSTDEQSANSVNDVVNLWNEFIEATTEIQGKDAVEKYLGHFTPVKFDGKVLVLSSKSRNAVEDFRSSTWMKKTIPFFISIFGEGTTVEYEVGRK